MLQPLATTEAVNIITRATSGDDAVKAILAKIAAEYGDNVMYSDIVGIQENPSTSKVRPIRVIMNYESENSADEWEKPTQG